MFVWNTFVMENVRNDKVRMDKGSYGQRFVWTKVRMDKGSYGQRFVWEKVRIGNGSYGKKFEWEKFLPMGKCFNGKSLHLKRFVK